MMVIIMLEQRVSGVVGLDAIGELVDAHLSVLPSIRGWRLGGPRP
jgi:hypothetical protein